MHDLSGIFTFCAAGQGVSWGSGGSHMKQNTSRHTAAKYYWQDAKHLEEFVLLVARRVSQAVLFRCGMLVEWDSWGGGIPCTPIQVVLGW